jgi:hypothetical protein
MASNFTSTWRKSGALSVVAGIALLCASFGLAACTPMSHGSGPPPLTVGCHDGVDPGVGDIRYDGPINTFHNGAYMSSTDGTCSVVNKPLTFIYAASLSMATTRCTSIDPGTSPFHLQLEYGVPDGYYYCF